MKILHCSDIHLGRRPVGAPKSVYSSKRYDDYFLAFEKVIEYAVNNGIHVFIVAGDLFDRRELSPEVLSRTQKILQPLKDAGIRMLLVEGNHDKAFSKEESWLSYLSQNSYFELLDFGHSEAGYSFEGIEIEGITFYGAGYPGALADEVLSDLSDRLTGENNVIIVHTFPWRGSGGILPGYVSGETLDTFRGKVLYMAGGHLHSRSSYPESSPFFFIPGSLEYWDIAERGEKGFVVFDTGTKEVRFFDSTKRKKQILNHEVKALTQSSFREELAEFLRNSNIERDALVVLELATRGNDFTIDLPYCDRLLEEAGALKGFTRPKRLDSPVAPDFSLSSLSVEEMEKRVIETAEEWSEFSSRAALVTDTMKKLKTSQTENLYEDFTELMNVLLEKLLEGGDSVEN